jgi:4-hydroxybenzoate polyprenyltransferase
MRSGSGYISRMPAATDTAPSTSAQALASRQREARFLRRSLSCLRYGEILVLQGSPLLGAAFTIGKVTAGAVAALAVLTAASCCLVAHIFVLNDWAGMSADLQDPNRTTGAFAARGIRRTEIGGLGMALLALSLLLFGWLGLRMLAIALAIAILSALYSLPPFHGKGIPLLNSALHFAGGVLHFLLGWSLFAAIDRRGIEIAVFFALAFVAGHLTQEVRDHEVDRLNGITTNAVRFGKTPIFAAALAVFTLAYLQLAVLAFRGMVPRPLGGLVAVLYPLHLYWSLRTFGAGLTFDSIRRLQARYRGLYTLIGAATLAALLLAR